MSDVTRRQFIKGAGALAVISLGLPSLVTKSVPGQTVLDFTDQEYTLVSVAGAQFDQVRVQDIEGRAYWFNMDSPITPNGGDITFELRLPDDAIIERIDLYDGNGPVFSAVT